MKKTSMSAMGLLVIGFFVVVAVLRLGENDGPEQPVLMNTVFQPLMGVAKADVGKTEKLPAKLDVSCPGQGMGRRAVMAPMAMGNSNMLVYFQNNRLKMYEIENGEQGELQVSNIVRNSVQISADGQWLLFMSSTAVKDVYALQVMRMYGVGLQTVYCVKDVKNRLQYTKTPPALWSPDQKSIVVQDNLQNYGLKVLEVETGEVKELVDKNSFSNTSAIVDVRPELWHGNGHIYVEVKDVYNDVEVYRVQTTGIVKQSIGVVSHIVSIPGFYEYDLVTSPDGTKIVLSYYHEGVETTGEKHGPSFVEMATITGGETKSLYGGDHLVVSGIVMVSEKAL